MAGDFLTMKFYKNLRVEIKIIDKILIDKDEIKLRK